MRERAVDEDPDVVLAAVREDLVLDLAAEDVVGRLERVDPTVALEVGRLVRAEIGDPHVARLALGDELLERGGRLLEWGVRVGPVDLVEIDVVGAELPEALLDSLPQPIGARVAPKISSVHPQAALGCDDDRLAA